MTESVDQPKQKPKTALWKRILQAVISIAIVVGIFAGVMPLIADYGDVFDTMHPTAEAQALYFRFLARVGATGVRDVVVVGGNHDSPSHPGRAPLYSPLCSPRSAPRPQRRSRSRS